MHPPLPPDRVAELLRAYLAADYRCAAGGRWHPLRIGQRAGALEADLPDCRRFAAITAWDPQSIPQPDALNRQADAALRNALVDGGWGFGPARAAAPEGGWEEPGWLVYDMAVDALDALARRFGQLGALCWPAGAPVRLRMYVPCPPACAGLPHIDWCGRDETAGGGPGRHDAIRTANP